VSDLVSNDSWTLNSSAISFGNAQRSLAWGASQYVTVTATIDPSQHYATYYGTVTVTDTFGEGTIVCDVFTLEVVVGPIEAFDMPDTVVIYGDAGTLADTCFAVTNVGNKTIERIEMFAMTDFFSADGIRIPKSSLEFTPPILIDSMRIGESAQVIARVSIPKLTLPTMYVARAKAMQQRGDPAKNFVVVLYVNYQNNISEGLTFSDNPVTGAFVNIGYLGDVDSRPKMTIMNMAAEIVRTEEFELKYGTTSGVFNWNLCNAAGKSIASGMYAVILQTKINGEDKVFTKKLLIVK
jgi:hypothetical protein